MRWLIVHPGPEFSVADVFAGWTEALIGLGEDVVTYNMNDRMTFYGAALIDTGRTDHDGARMFRRACTPEQAVTLAASGVLAECYKWWPDVVLMVSGFFMPDPLPEIMHARGHKIVLLHTESPYEDEHQLRRAAHADVNLLNDPHNLDLFRQVCQNTVYMPHAFRPGFHQPGPPVADMVCDLTFNGTGYASRVEFFEAMNLAGLDVMLTGNWTQLNEASPLNALIAHEKDRCLDNRQVVDLYRSARAGINVYRREALDGNAGQGWAMGPREVEMAACGLFALRDPRGEGDEVLWMLPTFDSPGDASEKVRWWLHPDRDTARADAAHGARQAVAGRTFTNHARELMRLLDKQPVTVAAGHPGQAVSRPVAVTTPELFGGDRQAAR